MATLLIFFGTQRGSQTSAVAGEPAWQNCAVDRGGRSTSFTGCVSSDVSDGITRLWVRGYTCSRIRDLPRWPVQFRTCRSHEVCYWHSAACYERCRACRQWHKKVRPWPDSNLAWWLTPALCGRSSNVQTRCHHAQMSAWQGSTVPCRLLHTAHRCCRQAASQVSHTATDGGATTSAIHCWTPSICYARPHGVKLLAGRPPRTAGLLSPLDRAWKHGFSQDTSVFSALETFVIIALYKSTFIYHLI